MRGLDRLITARRQGLKPAGVVVVSTLAADSTDDGTVVIDAADSAATADLRAFKGLAVLVVGEEFGAVDAWAQAIANADATSVAINWRGESAILKHNGEMMA